MHRVSEKIKKAIVRIAEELDVGFSIRLMDKEV